MARMQFIEPPHSVSEGTLVDQPADEIWVRTSEHIPMLARKLMDALDSSPYVDLSAIGAGALSAAVKGVSLARRRAEELGLDLVMTPYFSVVIDDRDRERTRTMLRVFLVDPS